MLKLLLTLSYEVSTLFYRLHNCLRLCEEMPKLWKQSVRFVMITIWCWNCFQNEPLKDMKRQTSIMAKLFHSIILALFMWNKSRVRGLYKWVDKKQFVIMTLAVTMLVVASTDFCAYMTKTECEVVRLYCWECLSSCNLYMKGSNVKTLHLYCRVLCTLAVFMSGRCVLCKQKTERAEKGNLSSSNKIWRESISGIKIFAFCLN